jgi:hypothetical protein
VSRGQAIVRAVRNDIEPSRPYGVIIPDFYFDWLFPLLLPSEISVLLYACRSILGYSRHRAERTDLISLSQIRDGVRAGDRVYRRGTGLALSTIQLALAALERANILYPVDVVGGELVRVRQKPRGRGCVTRYTLVERAEDIDWKWLEGRREPAAEPESEEAKTADLGDKSTDLPGVKPPVGREFSQAKTIENRGFSDKTTDFLAVKLPIIDSTDNNLTDNQLTECFAFGSAKRLPRRDPGSEGLRAYRKATGFNPLPAAREALLELEAEIGTGVFLDKLKEFVLWGKNVRNVAFFCDFARGQAVLAKPRADGGGDGKRNPSVRRVSRWTEEELRAAREADAGREWPDPPDDDEPESSSAGILSGGQEYQDWLRAVGGLSGPMARGP